MLFLHLFNRMGNVDLCHNLLYIGDEPLVYILSRASNPVAFFLILGGYGLYRVWERGDTHRWSRLIKLMIHYWIILTLFLIIGHFINPAYYPGDITCLIYNFTAYFTSYNGEMWFLLPYMILSAISPWLFKLMQRFRCRTVIAFTLFIYLCTSYCISRFGPIFLYSNYWAYNPLLVFHLMFNFSLGAMAARSNFFENFKAYAHSLKINVSVAATLLILILVGISCVFKYNFFYAFMFISLFQLIKLGGGIHVLSLLGKQSMNMWMIHSWFCYYLFRGFIYSFSYPILIFTVLIIISYVSGIIIDRIALPIEHIFISKKSMKEKPVK